MGNLLRESSKDTLKICKNIKKTSLLSFIEPSFFSASERG